ncbi:MAG: LPS export ABC transporter periplasmic protein LptC [Proteobacteria bacterium]|nr:LPS export ABC transporter periplasmic protein LptC [Pseudomonadota bacterium]
MKILKQLFWLFLIFLGILFFIWNLSSNAGLKKLDEKALAESIDATVKNVSMRRFNERGELVNYLSSPYMHHIPIENTHHFKSPKIVINEPNQSLYKITAKEAQVLNNGEKIIFNKDVVIHQPPSEKQQQSTMKTETLTYLPKEKLALTDAVVHFEQPGTTVVSKGMKAYIAEKRIQLLGKARAIYEPKHG